MRKLDELTAADLVDPTRYAQVGYPHEAWRRLRNDAPVRWFDLGARQGFWAITRREDIVWISKQAERFQLAPRQAVFADSPAPEERDEGGSMTRHLLQMDPPEHTAYRALAADWFSPKTIERLRPRIERVSQRILDDLCADGGLIEADFVADYAAPLTLSVLAEMLGVPPQDWPKLFEWTNQFIAASDPEIQGADSTAQTVQRARAGLFGYFETLAEERLHTPRDDIVSVLVHARLDDGAHTQPIPRFELLSYFALLVVAGNETTRNAASGGLLALIEHEAAFARLRHDASLIRPAVEEIVRWTSPVIQFCRTPVEDTELHGQRIRAGESFCLFYPSANRDERAFDDADVFRIDRKPNPHVGFGLGAHFCLGASLARLELRIIFEQLASRMEQPTLAGPMQRMRSSFLGGIKRMPIQCRLRQAKSSRRI